MSEQVKAAPAARNRLWVLSATVVTREPPNPEEEAVLGIIVARSSIAARDEFFAKIHDEKPGCAIPETHVVLVTPAMIEELDEVKELRAEINEARAMMNRARRIFEVVGVPPGYSLIQENTGEWLLAAPEPSEDRHFPTRAEAIAWAWRWHEAPGAPS